MANHRLLVFIRMPSQKISIPIYKDSDRSELLRLLIELHSTYFLPNSSEQLQELNEDVDIRKSFSDYLDLIGQNETGKWQIYLARTDSNDAVGFIIGSIEKDEYLVLNKIGKFEDW